jgi:hypothetical protein
MNNQEQDGVLKYPELVFGLVGAVGTDNEKIIGALNTALSRVKYNLVSIHLIEGVRQIEKWSTIPTKPLDDRYDSHMDAGNEFREILNRGDALSLLGIGAISVEREKATGKLKTPKERTAYVLRSLKRPEEVMELRRVYGKSFFALAAYSAKSKRLERLAEKIASSRETSISHGIARLAYIEPYPKSRATDLHDDSISVEDKKTGKHVTFQSFVGVAPRQYSNLFSLGDLPRKQGSKVIKWKPEDASPRFAESPFAYLHREEEELATFDLLLTQNNLIPVA